MQAEYLKNLPGNLRLTAVPDKWIVPALSSRSCVQVVNF